MQSLQHEAPMKVTIDFGSAPEVIVDSPRFTVAEYWDFCERNRDLRSELNQHGEIVLLSPSGAETGASNLTVGMRLALWTERDGTGIAFDSSAGFTLPNGAVRAADAAWVRRDRWDALTPDEKARFAPLCPDFVVEVLSPSDSLPKAQEKMGEWIENGAKLGLLIDRKRRTVQAYRPQMQGKTLTSLVETFDNPISVSGDPEMPGFSLVLAGIFNI